VAANVATVAKDRSSPAVKNHVKHIYEQRLGALPEAAR
jgi:hypothetical protein